MTYVQAQWAVFWQTAGEGFYRPSGPWFDSGIRAGTQDEAMIEWRKRPAREQNWVNTELRLVEVTP